MTSFRRALVTGASGFIGMALTRRLIEGGTEVVCTARRPVDATYGASWVLGDLADAGFTASLVADAQPDVVFHLAGEVTGSRSIDVIRPTFGSILAASVNVLVVATESACDRIVLIGSGDEPAAGDPPCSPYAAAKWAAGGYGRMFHALYDTPVTIARPFMVYGPDQPDLSKLVPYTVTSLLRGEAPVLGTGRRLCDWVYIDDVIDALVVIAREPACVGQTIDVGSGRLRTVRHVVDAIAAVIGRDVAPVWGGYPDRPGETEAVADVVTSQRRCGWSPSVDLATGLERTVKWYAGR